MAIHGPSVFLEALFGSKNPNSGYFLICRFNPIRTSWFKTSGEAIASIGKNETNVFISAGLSPSDLGSNKKGKEQNVMGVVGFSLDFDVAGKTHTKQNLFKSYEEVYETIAKFKLKPSIVVKSGHGIQAWWLLPKPWIFADTGTKESRLLAKELSTRLHYTFTQLTDKTIDSTFNLDRIMRLPGTINHKPPSPPVNVTIDQLNGVRYSIADIDAACKALPKAIADKKTTAITSTDQTTVTPEDRLLLSLNAQPSFLLFDALRASDVKFQVTWDKQRDKTEENPQGLDSPSEYDLSLASFAHNAGWPDQEIANLIIAWRVKHNQNPNKGLRFDYMRKTIDIVKKKSDLRAADRIIEDADAAGGFKVYTEKDRKLAIQTFIQKTGLAVTQYTKLCGEKPEYIWEFKIDGRDFEVIVTNSTNNMFRLWKDKVRGQTNKFSRPMKQSEWESLLEIANAFMYEVTTEDESDRQRTQVAAYLRTYLENMEIKNVMDKPTAVFKEQPFKEHGTWYVYADTFVEWCQRVKKSKNDKPAFISAFKQLKMRSTSVSARSGKTVRRRSYWPVPQSVCRLPAEAYDQMENIDDVDESEEYHRTETTSLGRSGL